MDAMTYFLTFIPIVFSVLIWIAWKQELRDRAKKKPLKP